MLDARYHFFYVIVIFLMLGFGILAGASFYGPAQVRQQHKYLAALRADVNRVVQERDEANDRLSKDEDALGRLRPSLVRGKLSGRRVVLIQTGDYADATQKAAQALTDAGASAATVVLTDKWAVLTPKQRAAILAGLGPRPAAAEDGDSDTAESDAPILAALATFLVHGTAASLSGQRALQMLESQGLITVTGDLPQPCSLFVLVGGGKDDSVGSDGADSVATLDSALVEQLRTVSGGGATVVGCEPLEAAVSFIPAYQNAGIATVDCIDLPLGQLALPFALRGEDDDYGVKATAKRPLPASLEENPAS